MLKNNIKSNYKITVNMTQIFIMTNLLFIRTVRVEIMVNQTLYHQ